MYSRILCHQVGLDKDYKTWHVNNRNMLIYMHSDGGSIVCNEKIYPIKRGMLFFVGSKKYHYTLPDNVDSYERSKVFATNEEMSRILSCFRESEGFFDTFGEESMVCAEIGEEERGAVERLFDEIARFSDDECNDAVFFSSYIRLLVYVSRNTIDAITIPQSFIYRAVEYINSNICALIGVEDVCRHVRVSKYHFCRIFKRTTGQTVMEYILKTRLALAKNMLAKGTYTVSEVSEHCGFSSISYFCRVFKDDTGVTPLGYRRGKIR